MYVLLLPADSPNHLPLITWYGTIHHVKEADHEGALSPPDSTYRVQVLHISHVVIMLLRGRLL